MFWTFWWKGTFEVRFRYKQYVFPEKMQKINGGQKSHTGSPGVDRYADYNGPTPNPNLHLGFELSPKNRFCPLIDLFKHWITWPFCLKTFPYLIHYLSQNINCAVPCHWELLVFEYFTIAFWARNWPLKTLGPKTVIFENVSLFHSQLFPICQPCQMFWLKVIGKNNQKNALFYP